VRNFAAIQIAMISGNEVPEKPERTAEEWAKVREKAKEAIEREPSSDRKP
jgi:hypothetical protein